MCSNTEMFVVSYINKKYDRYELFLPSIKKKNFSLTLLSFFFLSLFFSYFLPLHIWTHIVTSMILATYWTLI